MAGVYQAGCGCESSLRDQHIHRRPCESRDPYAAALVLKDAARRLSHNKEHLWLMGWTAPYGISCARMRLCKSQTREPSVDQIIRIGMDTSKHIFQLHGVDSAERPVLRRKLRRSQ